MVDDIRKALAYLWNLREKRIEKVLCETQHPYAKVQDKVDANRVGRKGRIFPFGKKVV